MRSTLSRQRASLLALLIAGLALRLFRLGADSLWYDETVSTYLAGSPAAEMIRHTAGDIHPPGYYLLLRAWLTVMGFADGRATTDGNQLEWSAGFVSVFFGVGLIGLAYVFARRLAGADAGLIGAAIVAFSPFNVWYSQEVRMYTLGAFLGITAVYAVHRALLPRTTEAGREASNTRWWLAYALAAAAGMYTLYYFVFLLIPLNAWVLLDALQRRGSQRIWPGWLAANLLALALYLPWLPRAVRQISDPPVPPWRGPTPPLAALTETWQALSLGQSAPSWAVPITLVMLAVFGIGLFIARPRSLIWLITLGPPVLILLASAATAPLYHVRYVFPFSPAVYATIAVGQARLWQRWKLLGALTATLWLVGVAAALFAFWAAPQYRADDLRQAVRDLYSRWRPGDAVLVNAGYAYTALVTYWPGELGERRRVSDPLPESRADNALLMLTTGHVDGASDLGWGDPQSDFYALPAQSASSQIAAAFERYPRLWHYRIYDTVTDPPGLLRSLLEAGGVMAEDRTYAGEANLRLQSFIPRRGARWKADLPVASFENGLTMQWQPIEESVMAGDRTATTLTWLAKKPIGDIATSLRLVGAEGAIWAQPEDERPLGPLYPSSTWPTDAAQSQAVALEVPLGTPPGEYAVQLVVYDPNTGRPFARTPDEPLTIGGVSVARPESPPELQPAAARVGPLQLLRAQTPATRISPGDEIPVEILWQAVETPDKPLVIVIQLLDPAGRVMAGIEEEPLQGRYPTQQWRAGEIVRDRHVLRAPDGLAQGTYRLVAGVYRAEDRERIPVRTGLLPSGTIYPITEIEVGP